MSKNSDRQITSETVWTRCRLGLDGLQENIHVQNVSQKPQMTNLQAIILLL